MADTPVERRIERCRRLLADVYGARIVDITQDDVLTFQAHLRRQGLMLVMEEAVIR